MAGQGCPVSRPSTSLVRAKGKDVDARNIGEPTGPARSGRSDDRLRDAVLRTAMCGHDGEGFLTRSVLGGFADFEPHGEACRPRQIHQRVEAELVDPAAHQVVQARLRQPQAPRRLGLIDRPALDLAAQRNHQRRARPQRW